MKQNSIHLARLLFALYVRENFVSESLDMTRFVRMALPHRPSAFALSSASQRTLSLRLELAALILKTKLNA